MRETLFRNEVMQAQSAQWLGTIRIGRPMAFAWVTGVALFLLAALLAFAMLGTIQRKARVSGVLLPVGGLIALSAPQLGVVSEILVREGDDVQAGQPLLRIRTERHLAQGEVGLLNAQALSQRRQSLQTERMLQQQQARQRGDALGERLRSLQSEGRQAQSELESSRQRAQLAQKSLDRFNELARSGYVSVAQVQQKQEELIDLQMRERSAERNLAALQRDVQSVQADLSANETSLKAALAQADRNIASLTQEANENEARGAVLIQAPQSGRVASLALSAGQMVQPGQPLLNLVPGGADHSESRNLEAQLYAPSRTSGFVQPGQQVWLRYAAYPFQKFGMARGRVLSVSQAPLSAQELPAGQAQALLGAAQSNNEPLYRIRVALDRQDMLAYGASLPLKPGMTLDADVLQQRLKIWEWMLEPLLSVSGLDAFLKAPDEEAAKVPPQGGRR